MRTSGTSTPLDARRAMAATRRRLETAGVDEAALEAEVLVRHTLGPVDRAALYAHPDVPLSTQQQQTLEALLARREQREPLPYILGWREFYGLTFEVTPAVLIPRPETEGLVNEALCWAGKRGAVDTPLAVADVGAGSGCIAVALARHLPGATVYATDASAAALEVAGRNVRRHEVEDRLRLLHGELLAPLPGPMDLVVANLPYVADAEWAALPPEVREHEPREALAGGPDGTDLLRRLLEEAPRWLRAGGAVMLEMDPRQREPLIEMAQRAFPTASVRVDSDLAGLDRYLLIEAAWAHRASGG